MKDSAHDGSRLGNSKHGRPVKVAVKNNSHVKMGEDSGLEVSKGQGSRIRNTSKGKESKITLGASGKKSRGWEDSDATDLGATALMDSKARKEKKSRVKSKSKAPLTLQEKLLALQNDGEDFPKKSKVGNSKVEQKNAGSSLMAKFGASKSPMPDRSNVDDRGKSQTKSRAKESKLEASRSPDKSRAQQSELAKSKADRLKMSKKPIMADSEVVTSQTRGLGKSKDRTKKSFMPDSMVASNTHQSSKLGTSKSKSKIVRVSNDGQDEEIYKSKSKSKKLSHVADAQDESPLAIKKSHRNDEDGKKESKLCKSKKDDKLKGSKEAEQWGSGDDVPAPAEKPKKRTRTKDKNPAESSIQKSHNPEKKDRDSDTKDKPDRAEQKILQSHNPEVRERVRTKDKNRDSGKMGQSKSPEKKNRDQDRNENKMSKSRSPNKLKSSKMPKQKQQSNFIDLSENLETPDNARVKIGASKNSDVKASEGPKARTDASDIGKTGYLDDMPAKRGFKESRIDKSRSPEKKPKLDASRQPKIQDSIEKTAYMDVLESKPPRQRTKDKARNRNAEDESTISLAPMNFMDSVNPSIMLESAVPKKIGKSKAPAPKRAPVPVQEVQDQDGWSSDEEPPRRSDKKNSEIAKSKADKLRASKSPEKRAKSKVGESKVAESKVSKSPEKKSKVKESLFAPDSMMFSKQGGESKVRGKSKTVKKKEVSSDSEDW